MLGVAYNIRCILLLSVDVINECVLRTYSCTIKVNTTELEIAVGHRPFSDQFQDLTNQN